MSIKVMSDWWVWLQIFHIYQLAMLCQMTALCSTVTCIEHVILGNRWVTVDELMHYLSLSWACEIETRIIVQLGFHKMCAWWVLQALCKDHKAKRMAYAVNPATICHSWPKLSGAHCHWWWDVGSLSHTRTETCKHGREESGLPMNQKIQGCALLW